MGFQRPTILERRVCILFGISKNAGFVLLRCSTYVCTKLRTYYVLWIPSSDFRLQTQANVSSFYHSFQTNDARMLKSPLSQVKICTNTTSTW
jgi:hypothetical protein